MKRLKDFFYDKNDILIALAILVIAALLIIWRMGAIMDYPKTLAEQTGTLNTTEDQAVDADKEGTDQDDADKDGDQSADSNKDGSDSQKEDNAGSSSDTLWADGALTKSVTVTVQGGSATGAVQSLMDAGLFESYEEYEQVCKAAGYTPENIKATTFTFEAGSTQTDIARMVTQ